MMRSMFVAAALVLAVACSKDPAPSGTAANETTRAAAAHASTGVTPGSYEDWCEEHQVPESQCTRCNPDLIPAFKATNDWCAEHGVPESQCLKCNPDLKIARPPKPGVN
jgi:hypothetical protein